MGWTTGEAGKGDQRYSVQIVAFCVLTSYILVHVYQRIGGLCDYIFRAKIIKI
jgi:hypothetical protein